MFKLTVVRCGNMLVIIMLSKFIFDHYFVTLITLFQLAMCITLNNMAIYHFMFAYPVYLGLELFVIVYAFNLFFNKISGIWCFTFIIFNLYLYQMLLHLVFVKLVYIIAYLVTSLNYVYVLDRFTNKQIAF